MSYALIARCPHTGQIGIGAASYTMAVGMYCDGAVRANTGVALTLGHPNPRNNHLAISLLSEGHTGSATMSVLLANDVHAEYRQIAVVDREGRAVAHSGARLRGHAGHRTGQGYAAFGDMLAGEHVLEAVTRGYQDNEGTAMEERLIAALEAARDAGGMSGKRGPLKERSAVVIVWGNRTYSEIDLRVDLHAAAIAELKRIYVDYKPSVAYYEERARNPRNAIPAMEFADMLKTAQGKEAT